LLSLFLSPHFFSLSIVSFLFQFYNCIFFYVAFVCRRSYLSWRVFFCWSLSHSHFHGGCERRMLVFQKKKKQKWIYDCMEKKKTSTGLVATWYNLFYFLNIKNLFLT
jgi:hypothetical protein